MFAKNIATVYFYVISAGSLILIVVGIFSVVNFILNSTQYQKYPLPYFQPDNCRLIPAYAPGQPIPDKFSVATLSAQENERQQKLCEDNTNQMRIQNKVNDLKNAITFSLVGWVLFAIHFPVALKRSRDSKS